MPEATAVVVDQEEEVSCHTDEGLTTTAEIEEWPPSSIRGCTSANYVHNRGGKEGANPGSISTSWSRLGVLVGGPEPSLRAQARLFPPYIRRPSRKYPISVPGESTFKHYHRARGQDLCRARLSTGHVTCEAVGHAWLCRMGEDDQQLMSETVNCYWGKFKISEKLATRKAELRPFRFPPFSSHLAPKQASVMNIILVARAHHSLQMVHLSSD
ncbi:hypothetical protein KCU68_g151, partial [Aureobasidium melanogenum]